MAGERLFIVEDERIVAEDLRDMLERLEYRVLGIASSGEEAVQKVEELRPDLVLMDIRLNGEMDGIQAAELIWAQESIPVTYLTAYADEGTLERAKATMPFGYILKPFEERDLRSTIEIALYKHRMESTLNKMEGWYASALENLTEAVIATNPQGCIVFMNPAAEILTGWGLHQVYGQKFQEALCAPARKSAESLSAALEQGSGGAPAAAARRQTGLLKTKDGNEVLVEYGANALRDEEGRQSGSIVILHAAGQPVDARTAVSS